MCGFLGMACEGELMAGLEWYTVFDRLKPHVVRISTTRGSGTGFLFMQGRRSHLCAVATAAHVIDHAHRWEEPIRIEHSESGRSVLIREGDRAIFVHGDDTAAIVLGKAQLPLPAGPLPLITKGQVLRVGNEIGWLGYPAIPGADLCFFGGRVSAWLQAQSAYLVDGVAINGVSGGPAFYIKGGKDLTLMGIVSAYAPNRATGETLPGLSVVRSVGSLHDDVQSLSSFEEAKEQQTPPSTASPPPDVNPPGSQQTGRRS